MAPSKNVNKHQKPDTQTQRQLKGRKVMYLGLGTEMTCPTCSRKRNRGMVSEYNGVKYCSEACVLKAV